MQHITWMPNREWGSAGPRSWRGRLSAALLSMGGWLIRWAWHLAPAATGSEPAAAELEFCRHGGGSDGAIYRNGQLVGTLAGVQRL
ncbi:hypothetical protein SAMN05216359_102713 [Roseateles sp. YR242]|uniref:hypothetical protein n=1 Tax=Roseateles sp. YR242 TaxID=1855305 RepID=UPI0008CDCE60|nr:hypothetical protein [Roseateles sp. YR242]SEK69932.1 hypothetical protein SAMN05216359_102713 [Roseateles sp. YR242]